MKTLEDLITYYQLMSAPFQKIEEAIQTKLTDFGLARLISMNEANSLSDEEVLLLQQV